MNIFHWRQIVLDCSKWHDIASDWLDWIEGHYMRACSTKRIAQVKTDVNSINCVSNFRFRRIYYYIHTCYAQWYPEELMNISWLSSRKPRNINTVLEPGLSYFLVFQRAGRPSKKRPTCFALFPSSCQSRDLWFEWKQAKFMPSKIVV